ncbi:hypothetical protein J6Q66_00130 [bacterium]|nr:hypothetical protein [bacterium]
MFNRKLNSQEKDFKNERGMVSRLILNVLCGYSSVKDALLKFPKNVDDASIIAAWHALSHYEADEELRAKDNDYKTEQDEFLEFIAFSLRDNKDLPINIINAYADYYGDMPIADNKSLKGKLIKFFRFLNIK